MPTRIGKSARQHLVERLARDPGFAEALAETRLEGHLAMELVRLRELRGMSQYDLAEATGIKQPMIARIERGGQNPTLPTLKKLAMALRATIQISATGVELRPDPAGYEVWAEPTHLVSTPNFASSLPQFFGPTPEGWVYAQVSAVVEPRQTGGIAKTGVFTAPATRPVGQNPAQSTVDENLVSAQASGLDHQSQRLLSPFIQPVA